MRMTKRVGCRVAIALWAPAVLTSAWGCGKGTSSVSSSTREATVSGTVAIQGKKATRGEVAFDPSNVRRKTAEVRAAEIGKDGRYTIKTLVGENAVRVVSPDFPRGKNLEYNLIKFDVKDGENALDIELPQKAP